jgi:predicted transcriptional regulator
MSDNELKNPTPETRAKAEKAWELKLDGWRQSEIAKELQCDPAWVSQMLKWYRENIAEVLEKRETFATLSLDRLETLYRWAKSHIDEGEYYSSVMLKCIEQERRMLGTDAAKKLDIGQKATVYRIDGVDLEKLR